MTESLPNTPPNTPRSEATPEDVAPVGAKKKKRRYTPRVAKHANSVAEEKLQEMFTVYCQMPNYSYVGRVCNVHIGTVRKYAVSQNWADRRDKIMDEARNRVDMDITTATEKSLSLIQQLKQKVQAKIDELKTSDMNPAFLVSDLERLVKMEQVLLGGVGDRTEKVSTSHEERIRQLREKRVINVTPIPQAITDGN